MNFRAYKPHILIAAVLVAIFVASLYLALFKFELHSIIDVFAGGRSNVKVSLFLFFILLLTAVSAYSRDKYRLFVANKWLYLSLGVSFSYGLFLLFLFTQKIHTKFTDFIITSHDSEISSTMLVHNHLMKGFNGLFLNLFGKAVQENVDTGWAFVGILPQVLFVIGGILFLISAVLLILKFAEQNKRQSIKTSWIHLMAFSIVGFSLLKNILDGGIFNRETPIAVIGLIFLISPAKYRYWSFFVLLLYLPSFFFPEVLLGNIVSIINFGLLLCMLLYWLEPNRKNRLAILLTILFALSMYYPLSGQVQAYYNSKQTILNNGAYLGTYHDIKGVNGKLVDKVNSLSLYYLPPQDITIAQILNQNQLLDNFGPIQIPWNNCSPADKNLILNFEVIVLSPINSTTKHQHELANLINLQLINQHGQSYRYSATLSAKPCTPRLLNVLDELIKEQGVGTYFLLNLKSNDGF